MRPRPRRRGGRRHQAGDRSARQGHQGAARLRSTVEAHARSTDVETVLEDVVLFTQRFAKQNDVRIVEKYRWETCRGSWPTQTSSSRYS